MILPFDGPEALAELLTRVGFGPDAARLAALGRHSVRLVVAPSGTDTGGRSKLGGLPDMPPGQPWPMRGPIPVRPLPQMPQGPVLGEDAAQMAYLATPQPLSFVAQFDLAQLAGKAVQDLGLPSEGMLYLFYDVQYQGWGFDPYDRAGFQVILLPGNQPLVPLAPPNRLGTRQVSPVTFPECPLVPHPWFEVPPLESLAVDALDLSAERTEAYAAFIRFLVEVEMGLAHPAATTRHMIGGWPDAVQDQMERDFALVSAGLYLGSPENWKSPEALAILAQPNDWRLVVQIDSDDACEMMWGDAGMLYLGARAADLAQGDVSKSWLVLQSY